MGHIGHVRYAGEAGSQHRPRGLVDLTEEFGGPTVLVQPDLEPADAGELKRPGFDGDFDLTDLGLVDFLVLVE